jgi:hypothetical protein
MSEYFRSVVVVQARCEVVLLRAASPGALINGLMAFFFDFFLAWCRLKPAPLLPVSGSVSKVCQASRHKGQCPGLASIDPGSGWKGGVGWGSL